LYNQVHECYQLSITIVQSGSWELSTVYNNCTIRIMSNIIYIYMVTCNYNGRRFKIQDHGCFQLSIYMVTCNKNGIRFPVSMYFEFWFVIYTSSSSKYRIQQILQYLSFNLVNIYSITTLTFRISKINQK
jgi:hypothetical protein